jgi:tRNA threonylcarbamoyladenosine biosynthesis protein TsaE
VTRHTSSEEETQGIARDLAQTLGAGDVVLLSGELGAGKTAFVRGLASGLGIDPADVTSPTFTLLHEYRGGRLPLYHCDLYRIQATEDEQIGLGLEDDSIAQGVLAIEWAGRLGRPIAGAITVTILATGEETRQIDIDRST